MSTSTEENKALARSTYGAVWIQENLATVHAVLTPDFADHDRMEEATGGRWEDPQALIAIWRAAFPDVALSIADQLAKGDRVLARWRATRTNRGPFLERPPTGKRLTIRGNVAGPL